jgi:hypothetical protein
MQAEAQTLTMELIASNTENINTIDAININNTDTIYSLMPPSPPTDDLEIDNTEPTCPRSKTVADYLELNCESIAATTLRIKQEQTRIRQEQTRIRQQEQQRKEREQRERQQQKLEQQRKRDQYRHLFDTNYTRGQFDYITDKPSRKLVKNAWRAVQLTETADFVKQPIESFSWCNDPRIWIISNKMEEIENPPGHSGFTFGWTMRQVQSILQEGEDNYRLDCLIDQMFKTETM